MKRTVAISLSVLLLCAAAAHADYVILRDGKSYSGTYRAAPNGKLSFKDNAGIEYTFPLADVQSVVFSNVADHISLKSGQSYTGQLEGAARISFRGTNGIGYVFPMSDVASVVFTGPEAQSAPAGGSTPGPYAGPGPGPYAGPGPGAGTGAPVNVAPAGYGPPAPGPAGPPPPGMSSASYAGEGAGSLVVPSGTQISVRTDETIDTSKDAMGRTYSGRIQQDVVDSTGNIGIPAGTAAKLQVVNLGSNDSSGKPDLALDLYSIDLNGTEYRVDSSSVTEKGGAGYGMNKRTAEYAGGGAALGALMGAIFGGGKGAGIGTLAGAGAGALGQYVTRGKQVSVPAESVLTFQVQQTLVLHP